MTYAQFKTLGFFSTFALNLLSITVYCIFSLVTVRKLRRNPATRDALGIPIILTGGYTGNVAQAFGCPQVLLRITARGPLRVLDADRELVLQHTSRLDSILGRVCFWLFVLAGGMTLTLCAVAAWVDGF